MPVSRDAYVIAYKLIESLPFGISPPEVGAEPDGHLTLEWHKHARRTLSVSIDPEGYLHYAALLGKTKRYGTEPYVGELPGEIIDLIFRWK